MAMKTLTIVRNKKEAKRLVDFWRGKGIRRVWYSEAIDSRGRYYWVGYDNQCAHGHWDVCPYGCHSEGEIVAEERKIP